MIKRICLLALVVGIAGLGGCAGFSRSLSKMGNGAFGADWIVVQFDMAGKPFNCWQLAKTSVASEEHSDGIYWQDRDGHLVHVAGWTNRVQVNDANWNSAAKTLGIDINKCVSGHYSG